jgi:hypothetical protein
MRMLLKLTKNPETSAELHLWKGNAVILTENPVNICGTSFVDGNATKGN